MTRTIGVVGAGTMGSGIAQSFATAGFDVRLVDADARGLERGIAAVRASLLKLETKGKLSDPAARIEGRIRSSSDVKDLAPAEVVVEAIFENAEAKAKLFSQLHAICAPATIFASNTSSIPITQLAGVSGRPELFVGMHFMNPVPVMTLVEVIRGLQTSAETVRAIRELTIALGKTPVESKDVPGFIANRILMPMINEAIFALDEGVGTAEDIDTVMRLGMNHPMGPLALADFIGLDVCLAVLEVLHRDFGDQKFRPAPLLKRYVQAGWLGRKSGRGIYRYDQKG